MMKIVLLGHTFWEHSGLSGYSRISDFIPNSTKYIYYRGEKLNSFKRIVTGGIKRISETRWFTWDSLRRQLAVYKEIRNDQSKKLFHFLYGENGFFWAARFAKKRGHFVCATFHNTPEMLLSMFRNTNSFKYLDAVILMSKTQIEFFRKINYLGKIYVIPHGIDTSYFTPDEKEHSRDIIFCISSGFFERDYHVLRQAAERLKEHTKIRFIIVSSRKVCEQFSNMNNVRTYTNIPDRELLALYRDSDVFLFSVKSATASNSLLEAMSCGLPIVTENIGGIPEYVIDDCAVFFKKSDIEGLCHVLIQLADSHILRKKMGLASRRRALELDWERIADETLEVYKDITRVN